MKQFFNLKFDLPKNSFFKGKVGDSLLSYDLYEVDQETILDEVRFDDISRIRFHVSPGQYVKRGDTIFSEGLFGYKIYVTEYSGIVDIREDSYRLVSQKLTCFKRVNLPGKIHKVKPGEFIIIRLQAHRIKPVFILNKLGKGIYRKIVVEDFSEFYQRKGSAYRFTDTVFVYNHNISLQQLESIADFGMTRLIINAIEIDDLQKFSQLASKMDILVSISGFGSLLHSKFLIRKPSKSTNYDVIVTKRSIYFSDSIEEKSHSVIYEHPFWGVPTEIVKSDNLRAYCKRSGDVFEIYKKNLGVSIDKWYE